MKLFGAVLIVLSFCITRPVQADGGREFFTSVLYGTVAGALVGTATLAFSSDPGDNLMNIARGASIGLYCGILLGAYLVYGTDNGDTNPSGTINPEASPPSDSAPQGSLKYQHKQDPLYGFSIFPTVHNGSVGVGTNLVTLHF